MKISNSSLLELARVHGYDTPMFPNEITADRNVRALAAVIADLEGDLPVQIMSNYTVTGGELKTVILVNIDQWQTPVYFDKWGFKADNMSKPLEEQSALPETYQYVVSALKP